MGSVDKLSRGWPLPWSLWSSPPQPEDSHSFAPNPCCPEKTDRPQGTQCSWVVGQRRVLGRFQGRLPGGGGGNLEVWWGQPWLSSLGLGAAPRGTLGALGPGTVGMGPFPAASCPPTAPRSQTGPAVMSLETPLACPILGSPSGPPAGVCSAHPHRTCTLGGLHPPYHTPVPRAPLAGQGPLLNK